MGAHVHANEHCRRPFGPTTPGRTCQANTWPSSRGPVRVTPSSLWARTRRKDVVLSASQLREVGGDRARQLEDVLQVPPAHALHACRPLQHEQHRLESSTLVQKGTCHAACRHCRVRQDKQESNMQRAARTRSGCCRLSNRCCATDSHRCSPTIPWDAWMDRMTKQKHACILHGATTGNNASRNEPLNESSHLNEKAIA